MFISTLNRVREKNIALYIFLVTVMTSKCNPDVGKCIKQSKAYQRYSGKCSSLKVSKNIQRRMPGASNYCIVTGFQSGGLNITARDVMGNIF